MKKGFIWAGFVADFFFILLIAFLIVTAFVTVTITEEDSATFGLTDSERNELQTLQFVNLLDYAITFKADSAETSFLHQAVANDPAALQAFRKTAFQLLEDGPSVRLFWLEDEQETCTSLTRGGECAQTVCKTADGSMRDICNDGITDLGTTAYVVQSGQLIPVQITELGRRS